MTKTRSFTMTSLAIAGAAGLITAPALAGPSHPCDDRIVFSRPVFVQPIAVQTVVARPVVVQAAPMPSRAISVPAGSDVSIRQGWAGGSDVRISAPRAAGYQTAWADAGAPVVVSSITTTPIVTSPSIIVVPNDPIVVSDTVVEPFGAHDRLVVLNEFTTPGSDGRTLLYRDASGLLHERSVYGSSGIFYDHLGRRCRYDNDRSAVVILDDHVVRDYNRNGINDDDRFVDLHRRAELQFHRDSIYRPIGTPFRASENWRDRYRPSGFRDNSSGFVNDRTPTAIRDDRPVSSPRRTGSAVNGRLIDDARLTGNERKNNSGARPKR